MTTVEEVIKEVRKIAAERPDFVYRHQPMTNPELRSNECSYVGAAIGVSEGEGCIVGQALSKLGVSAYRLRKHEGTMASQVLVELDMAGPVSTRAGYSEELDWLDNVQEGQDTGRTWGDAIRVADEA